MRVCVGLSTESPLHTRLIFRDQLQLLHEALDTLLESLFNMLTACSIFERPWW